MDIGKAYNIVVEKIEDWVTALIGLLPNIAVASIVVVLGIFLAKYLKKLFVKIVDRFIHHKNLVNLLASMFHLILLCIVIFAALSILQLDKTVTTLLAGAGVLGLGLAFAFQDIAANFVSGVFIAINRPFKAGETIKSKEYTGVVEIVHLRDTVIKTFQGQIVRIPNKDIFQSPLSNYTQLGKRRLDIEVGVSYGDDLQKAETIVLEAVKTVPGISLQDEPKVFFKEFSDSSINLEVFLWLQSGEQAVYLKARSEAVKAIKTAFDKNGITIPFPIRTLDFGIKGGSDLKTMLDK
ncbi:MAG: mechanosensitive ion channel family protein [Niabella sp.]